MAIQNISYNPFALSTARNAWQDQNNSLPTKIGKGAMGAVFDIFLKNPYELTVGNISKVIHNPEAYSTMTKIAVCAVAVLTIPYTLILYGSTIYLCGHCIEVLGNHAGLEAVKKAGEVVQSVGNNVFLAGATPLYATFYALPKYILESIPKIANFVSDRVVLAANWIFQNMLIPLWKGIEPLATKIGEVATTLYNFIAARLGNALQSISNLISSVAIWTLNNVLVPFWENTLIPLLKVIGRTIYYVLDQMSSSLHALKTIIENTAQWLFTNAIAPLWSNFVQPSLKFLTEGMLYLAKEFAHVLSVVAEKVAHIAQWLFTNALEPLWNNLVQPSLKFLAESISYFAKEIANVLSVVAGKVTHIAGWIMQNALAPAWNLLQPVFEEIGKAAIRCVDYIGESIPVLIKTVSEIAFQIFQNMLVPAFNKVVNSAVTVGNFFNSRVIVPAGTSFASLIEKVSEILSRMLSVFG